MRLNATRNRLGYGMIMAMFIGAFTMVLTTTTFAASGPKCPCYKAKDLEKLLDKGWGVESVTQTDSLKAVILDDPANPDYSQKGKRSWQGFEWKTWGDGWDGCVANGGQNKWQSNAPYSDKGKTKSNQVGIPTGDPNSVECETIMENFINGLN